MKICSSCKQEKELGEYFIRDKRTNRFHAQCKQCYAEKRRQAWKEYYYRHGSKYRRRAIVRNRRLKQILREKMLEYLSDKACQTCGNKDPRVLEFDHINPTTKSVSIAKAIHNIWSWENILKEIKKCQILCANCHKIKTSNEQGWYKVVV